MEPGILFITSVQGLLAYFKEIDKAWVDPNKFFSLE